MVTGVFLCLLAVLGQVRGTLVFSGQNWGSFEEDRTAPVGPEGEFSTFTGIVEQYGNIITKWPNLTSNFLDTVTVFYTSRLKHFGGGLEESEAEALLTWVNNGGVLILTYEWESMSSAYVPSWTDLFNIEIGMPGIYDVALPVRAETKVDRILTKGVDTLHIEGGTEVKFRDESTVVYTKNTQQDSPAVYESSDSTEGTESTEGTGESSPLTESTEQEIPPSIAEIRHIGEGVVFLIGDTDVFHDQFIHEAGNQAFCRGLVRWTTFHLNTRE